MTRRRMRVLNTEIKRLMDLHQRLQDQLDTELLSLWPRNDVINPLKRRKLQVKDKIVAIAATITPTVPINPSLFALSDEAVEEKLTELNLDLQAKTSRLGPTARELIEVKSDVSAVEREIERRKIERLLQPEDSFKPIGFVQQPMIASANAF